MRCNAHGVNKLQCGADVVVGFLAATVQPGTVMPASTRTPMPSSIR